MVSGVGIKSIKVAPKVLTLLLSKEIALALIAGVVVVVADWKNSAFCGLRKINCTLQNASQKKWWVAG